jgi:hypothetical protein
MTGVRLEAPKRVRQCSNVVAIFEQKVDDSVPTRRVGPRAMDKQNCRFHRFRLRGLAGHKNYLRCEAERACESRQSRQKFTDEHQALPFSGLQRLSLCNPDQQ